MKNFSTLCLEDQTKIIQYFAEDFKKLSNSSLFITGATGFFGKSLLEILYILKLNYKLDMRIGILTRDYQKFVNKNQKLQSLLDVLSLEVIEDDITNFRLNEKWDHLIHLATDADPEMNRSESIRMLTSITDGALNVFKNSKSINRSIIFSSSGAVYGSSDKHIKLEEDTPVDWNNFQDFSAYIHGKRIAETLANAYREEGVNIHILRCFTFYGPHQDLNKSFAAPNFIKQVMLSNQITIKGDGKPVRSFMYSVDLAMNLLKFCTCSDKNLTLNIGSSEEISIVDFAACLSNVAESVVKIENGHNSNSSSSYYVPSTLKAKSFGFCLELTPLEEGLRRALKWHEENLKS